MFLPNIDTLVFTVLTRRYNTCIEKINPLLETNQESAKKTGKNTVISLGWETFELLPNGARNYKYILHNNKYEIKLQQVHNEKASNYPIYVKLKSEFLWNRRDKAYYDVIDYLESIFGEVESVKISRCDLCCHTDQIDMSKLKLNKFVTRSTSRELHLDSDDSNIKNTRVFMTGKRITGISFGKSPIRCRIYDKHLEILQSSKKTWFQDIWKENGVLENSIVVNVEFQLNREFMKLHNIDTYAQLNDEIKSIWIYLTTKWLRYVILDNTQSQRCTTEPIWDALSHAYDLDWKSINGIERSKQLKSSREHMLNMIRCYMINDAALVGETSFIEYCKQMFADVDQLMFEKKMDFQDEVTKKYQLYA